MYSERLLFFPSQQVGFVYLSTSEEISTDCWDWDKVCEAKGIVLIPEGKMAKLDININTSQTEVVKVLTDLATSSIQELKISGKNFDETILKPLNNLTELKSLSLLLTSIRRLDDLDFSNFNKLTVLHLGLTDVAGHELMKISSLKNLESLSFSSDDQLDDWLDQLAHFKQLNFLGLRLNRISDKGILHLQKLTNLQVLDLSGTQITDKGLLLLAPLTKLKTLTLECTFITENAAKKLKQYLPACNIYLKPG